jgi:M6 family metalloprotease-like protein
LLGGKHLKKYGALLLVILAGCLSALALESPAPGEVDQYRRDGTLNARVERARRYGNHRVKPWLAKRTLDKLATGPRDVGAAAPLPDWAGMPTTGTNRILVFLIDFPDATAANAYGTITNKLFGAGEAAEYPLESLQPYYLRSSYGKLLIQGDALGWYRMAHERSWYTTQYGEDNYANAKIIEEVATHYDATHDYRQYDNNGDGKIDYFAVVWAGSHGAWASFWWGYQWQVDSTNLTLDGVRLYSFSWQWESYNYPSDVFTADTIIHETGHALGVPDYYDYSASVGPAGGVGGLDMMDGAWGDHNGFSKFMLDWLTPTPVTSNLLAFPLRASAQYPDAATIMNTYTGGTPYAEYFLVQNRYRVLNDTDFPGDGLLIWHVDARPDATGNDFLYDNSYTAHKLLRLMEADGREEIEQGFSAGASDYYTQGQFLTPFTAPNSLAYDGSNTSVFVGNLSANGTTMTVDLMLDPNGLFALSASAYEVSETAGVAAITVVRTWGSSHAGSIAYATSDGTAKSGADYTGVTGTLAFAEGVTSNTFSIPLQDDANEQSDETVHITLANPSSAAFLGVPSQALLTIFSDDDGAPPKIADVTVQDSNTVMVLFDQRVDGPTAESATNYGLSPGGAVHVGVLAADRHTLWLGVATLSNATYALSVAHVRDLEGLAIAGAPTNFVLPDPKLDLWLKLDEDSGTTAQDSSVYGHTGTLVNGPAWATGRSGGAVTFDEVDDHVLVPDFAYGPECTVSFWFRASDNSGGFFQYVFSHGMPQTLNDLNVYVGEDASGYPDVLRTSYADSNDGTDQAALLSLDVPLPGFPDSLWHLYTLTVKTGEGARVYLDGQLRAANPALGGDAIDPATGIYVGSRNDLNPDRAFGGLVDDVRLYNRALRPGEVAWLYNTRPQAAIVTPRAGAEYVQREAVEFSGTGTDPDGAIRRLVWNSSASGDLGAGGSASNASLAPGLQTVRLFAYDNQAAWGETSLVLRIWADAQTNGLPDYWETNFWPAGNSGGGANDFDRDGLSNFGEWVAGTDPTNGASAFRILELHPTLAGDGMALSWSCVSNRRYTVCGAPNTIVPFVPLADPLFAATNGSMTYTGAVSAQPLRGFYRVDLSR